jgi:hypothetical protein
MPIPTCLNMLNLLPDPADILTVEMLVGELRQTFRRKGFYSPTDSDASIRFHEGQQSVLQWLEDRISK